jgi:hypothetical protein
MGTVFRKLDTPSSSVSSGFIGVGQAQPGAHRLQGNGALEESFCFFQAAVGFHLKSVAKIAHVMVGIEFQCTFKGNNAHLPVGLAKAMASSRPLATAAAVSTKGCGSLPVLRNRV